MCIWLLELLKRLSMHMCCAPLSSVPLQGVIEEQIQQHVSGFNNWNITKHAQSYLDAFMGHRSDLVYLTAGALASRALPVHDQRTARLPIKDYLRLQAAPVMTVNQVSFFLS